MCFVNINGSWSDLQMIITKNTVDDMIKIGAKLILFFKDQINNSRIVWGQEFDADYLRHQRHPQTSTDNNNSGSGFHYKVYQNSQQKNSEDLQSLSSIESTLSTTFSSETAKDMEFDKLKASQFGSQHWHSILDELTTQVQIRRKLLPLPTAANGVTYVGGNISLEANRICVACMNGEMNASSWALFFMSDVGVRFSSRSNYTFLDSELVGASDSGALGIETNHDFVFRLGEEQLPEGVAAAAHHLLKQEQQSHSKAKKTNSGIVPEECKAVVCRVQQNRGLLIHNNAGIDLSLKAMIGDVLKQMKLAPTSPDSAASKNSDAIRNSLNTPPKFSHNILQLFQFPALQAVLHTRQQNKAFGATDDDENVVKKKRKKRPHRNSQRAILSMEGTKNNVEEESDDEDFVKLAENVMETVFSSFICDFSSAVGVQTDFNAQVSFLPELLKSYISSHQSDIPASSKVNTSLMAKDSESATYSQKTSPRRILSSSSLLMHNISGGGSGLMASPRDHSSATLGQTAAADLAGIKSQGLKKDHRKYVCQKWIVDPKIQFIDRFKWNPPVVDDILKKLQIFDHRRTIPKVMQRGVLDRCDFLLASIMEQILNQVKRE